MTTIHVIGCVASPDHVALGTAGSYGVETIQLTFSDDWQGLTVYTVWDCGVSVLPDEHGCLTVPPEATAQAGQTAFKIVGLRNGAKVNTVPVRCVVACTLDDVESDVPPETQTLVEQMLIRCGAAASEAEDEAQNAAEAAESATQAAGAANEAAEAAQDAADLAQQKANAANSAAAYASGASSYANEKAALADAAATAANAAAGDAADAADDANAAAATANTAATSAYGSASVADHAAANANQKATLAEQAATTAAGNAQLAYNKAGLADAKATLAQNAAQAAEEAGAGAVTAAINANTAAAAANAAADRADAAAASIADKADIDGEYDDMTVGTANQLLSTVGETDRTPYLFRQTGGGAAVGDRARDTLVGGTVVWNQLAVETPTSSYQVTATFAGGVWTFGGNAATNNAHIDYLYHVDLHGHILYISQDADIAGIQWSVRDVDHSQTLASAPRGDKLGARLITVPQNCTSLNFTAAVQTGTAVSGTCHIRIHDLTQMFGAAVDAQITEEQFDTLFPKAYYPYNAGELMSVCTSARRTVGFNLLDKAKETDGRALVWDRGELYDLADAVTTDFIRVIEGTYYTNYKSSCFAYDEGKNYIGAYQTDGTWAKQAGDRIKSFIVSGAAYIRFVFRPGDNDSTDMTAAAINVNISCARNGEYEPFIEHVYPLDSTLTLRGKPMLDAEDHLYYDGDTYQSDGTVTRRYGQRAYQSGDESDPTLITDGTYTVYPLSTPVTETAAPFCGVQTVDPDGTEEYVDERAVPIPVGHVTVYPQDLRGKLERLPANVQSMHQSTIITIEASDWDGGSYTATVDGMTATALVLVEYSDADGIYTAAQGENTMTFTASPVPGEDIAVKVGWFV